MDLRAGIAVAVIGLTIVGACSDPNDLREGGGSAATGGDSGTAGTRSFTPDPGCRSNGDCPELTCFRFGDGPGVCATPSEPVAACEIMTGRNECCSSEECSEGRCFRVNTPQIECSPSGVDTYNRCVVDACESDQDCLGGLCSPAGYGAPRVCILAGCSRDEDCAAEPGGACALLSLGCCGYQVGGATKREARIACVYPSDGCQADDDCTNGEYCVVVDGRAQCSASCS